MNDTISRQAAIDGADKIIERDTGGNNDVVKAMQAWKEWVKALPSAQPEPSQIARDIATIIENEQDLRVILAQPQHTHCKDCKYSEYDRLCGVMRCTYHGKAEVVHGEHYCGYADMREGDG